MKNNEKLLVYEKPCKNCLFTEERLIDEKRANEVIQDCLDKDTFFVCHKSTISNKGNVCCNLYFKKHQKDVKIIRIAKFLNVLEFVPLPNEDIKYLSYKQRKES